MYAEVIIDQDAKAIDRVFEYIIPQGLDAAEGMRVRLPFGKRVVQGFIIKIKDQTEFDQSKLKAIIEPVDEFACIKTEMLELMKYMAIKNHLTYASILRLFITSQMREGKVKPLFVSYYSLAKEDFVLPKSAKKQLEIVQFIKEKTDPARQANLQTLAMAL